MTRRTILVVDDDYATTLSLRHAFGEAFEISTCFSPAEVFEELGRSAVALVLVAEKLPEADGIALLKEIRTGWPHLPLVLTVEKLAPEVLLEMLRAGCREVLQKPLCASEVAARLENLLIATEAEGSRNVRQMRTRLKGLFTTRKSKLRGTTAAACAAAPGGAATTLTNAPLLSVKYYGEFRVCIDKRPVASWPSRKSKLLFAYLAMHHKRRVSREVLMDNFWPNAEPEAARNSLNVALHQIRRTLHELVPGYDFISFKDDCYYFNPELAVTHDVEKFQRHWKRAQCLERAQGREAALPEYEAAANLYRGDFMEDEVYENWASSQREHLKEIYLLTLDRISKAYSLNGKPELAVNLCQRMLSLDSCREDVHRRLMLCYYRLGKRDKALKQFKQCEEILQAELEVKPTRTTYELLERIKNGAPGRKKNSL